MPRPRFLSRGATWKPTDILPEGPKSRRRRLLNHITRFASSPSLSRSSEEVGSRKQAVSCVSLEGVGIGDSYGLGADTQSSLELFVDCEDGKEEISTGLRWDALPNEVKMGVLQWFKPKELVRVSVVSKEFYRLCFDGQLWETLDASEFYNSIPVEQLANLIVTAGAFVRHLNLRGCVQLQKDLQVETVANLLSASLEGCKFERATVNFIITRNPQLVHINLSGLLAVTNSTCRSLSKSCPMIQSLNVSFCTNADGRGLRKVVDACSGLRDLRACELNINDPGLMQALFVKNMIERLQFGDAVGVTDEFVRLLVEGVDPEIDPFTDRSTAPPRKLLHLDLRKCTQLTDNALRHLTDNVPHLRRLELGGVVGLTDAGLAQLLPTVPRLSHLDVEECTELTNTTLLNLGAAKHLVHLQVSYCESMSDPGMMELLRNCERLRVLEMDNTRISDLTLAEAAHVVRTRTIHRDVTKSPASQIALRLVVFDCSLITWDGVREIMNRNAESMRTQPEKPGMVLLKCFYEYQKTVDEHTKLVLRNELEKADLLEGSWAEYMTSVDDASRRRARRRRGMIGWDGGEGRRGGRSTVCSIM